jgi:hypothetical protein
VVYNDLGQNKLVIGNVTNVATAKTLQTFNVSKDVDSITNLDPTERTFFFDVYKVVGGVDVLLASGSVLMTGTSAQTVTAWSVPPAAGGGSWDPLTYLWEIGVTYKVLERMDNNYYTLADVVGDNLTKLYAGTAPDTYIVGASFTVTDSLNIVSVLFENERNVINDIRVVKQVQDEGGTVVPRSNWATGSAFVFGIYAETGTGGKYMIGLMTVTDDQPLLIQTTEAMLHGNSYYIKELSFTPSWQYERMSITGSGVTLEPDDGSGIPLYKFTASKGLVITATNRMLDIQTVDLRINKQLVNSSGATLVPATDIEYFVFMISNGTQTFYEYVTIPVGGSNVTVTVTGLPAGTYTVTELQTNWRYTLYSGTTNPQTKVVDDPDASPPVTFTFKNVKTNDQWQDDTLKVKNNMPPLATPKPTPTPGPTPTPTRPPDVMM